MYWRRGRTLDKTGERELCCLVCSAGTFIGCVCNVKSKLITQAEKSDKSLIRLHKLFMDAVGCYKRLIIKINRLVLFAGSLH